MKNFNRLLLEVCDASADPHANFSTVEVKFRELLSVAPPPAPTPTHQLVQLDDSVFEILDMLWCKFKGLLKPYLLAVTIILNNYKFSGVHALEVAGAKEVVAPLTTIISSMDFNFKIELRLCSLDALSMLALPITYVKNLYGNDDTNSIEITELTLVFQSAISNLITTTIKHSTIQTITAMRNSTMTTRLVELIFNLHMNANENFRLLRLHLSKENENESFVVDCLKPHLDNIIKTNKKNKTELVNALRVMAIMTFKNKAVRECAAKNHYEDVKQLCNCKEGRVSAEVLSALMKLHINIEGGHGENWRRVHTQCVKLFFDAVSSLKDAEGGGGVGGGGGGGIKKFLRLFVRGEDRVPCNKAKSNRAMKAFSGFIDVGAPASMAKSQKKKRNRKKKKKKKFELKDESQTPTQCTGEPFF